MKKIIVLLFIILSNFQAIASRIPISLSTMAEQADLIFHGKIINEINRDIEVSILKKIKGEYKVETILVEKFQNWACASRYKPYELGQEELFFLNKNKKKNTWEIIGGGNEGEIPVVNGTVYFKSSFLFQFPKKMKGIHQLKNGEKMYGYTFDLREAIKGISLYIQTEEVIKVKFLNISILDYYPKNKFFLTIINEMICENRRGFTKEEFVTRNFDFN